jgi:hypothetical protein
VKWLLLLALLACSGRDVEKENGYRDFHFGQRIEDLPQLEHWRHEAPGHESYVFPGEDLTLGDAKIGRVEYHFYDGELFEVIVRSGDPQNMLAAMKSEYGTPPFDRPWEWGGETVKMKLTGSNIDKNCTIRRWNIAVDERRKQELPGRKKAELEALKKERAERAAEGAAP